MTMIMTGVARTGGKVASLKRLARWSGVTTRLNEPLTPTGMDCMGFPSTFCRPARDACIEARMLCHRLRTRCIIVQLLPVDQPLLLPSAAFEFACSSRDNRGGHE